MVQPFGHLEPDKLLITILLEPVDIIYLHDLAVECVIGAWDWERDILQTVYIDLDMAWDIEAAGHSDELEDTLSYKDIAKAVSELVVRRKFKLVEAMATEIAQLLDEQFNIPWCRVKINKRGAVSTAGDVGVVIERGEE
jgi:dihydroneopterin aldolase